MRHDKLCHNITPLIYFLPVHAGKIISPQQKIYQCLHNFMMFIYKYNIAHLRCNPSLKALALVAVLQIHVQGLEAKIFLPGLFFLFIQRAPPHKNQKTPHYRPQTRSTENTKSKTPTQCCAINQYIVSVLQKICNICYRYRLQYRSEMVLSDLDSRLFC